MNATQRLIEAVEEVFRLSQLDYDGIDILVQRAAANQEVKDALAAAKEEQAKVDPVAWMLDDGVTVETEWREYHNGPEWTPLYLAPPKGGGLTVEGVMEVFDRCSNVPDDYDVWASDLREPFRKALEDLAENSSDNLRKG